MFDTSKQSFRWNLVLFAPTLVALSIATLAGNAAFKSQALLIVWGIFNAICSYWCGYDYARTTTNLSLRYANTFGLGSIFLVLNTAVSFFGGCVCVAIGGGR